MSDYYSNNAKKYFNDTVDADVSELYRPLLSRIINGAHILDAGCGSGRDSLYFIKKGYKVTAIDASEEMANLASKYIRQPVLVMRFQDIKWENEFDAIWACATLLHVPNEEIVSVFIGMNISLKSNGIINGSFKYGSGERASKDDRSFLDMNEAGFDAIIKQIPNLRIEKTWTTNDVRPGREHEKWFNFIVRKISE